MKALFSTGFKAELLDAETKYAEISGRLAGDFRERVAGQVREINRQSDCVGVVMREYDEQRGQWTRGHQIQIDQLDNAIRNLQNWINKNCPPDKQ